MATPWKGLEKGAIVIAHISDPHFGSERASEVWRLAAEFLVNDLKPELILVTGDLVHTPAEEWYNTARDALDNLRRPYFVCAGNHDRFVLGNRVEQKLVSNLTEHPQGKELIEKARQQVRRLAVWVATLFGLFVAVLFGIGLSLIAGPLIGSLIGVIAGLLAGLFVYGWSPGFVERRLARWLNARIADFDVGLRSILFESKFKDHDLAGTETRPITLGQGAGKWEIGLLALESSIEADCFARGKITSNALRPLPTATQGKQLGGGHSEFDLCVLLVHHHLLPIRALEKEREGNATDLVNATCLVNTGTLLEKLAESRIDLALHGHEHRHNWGTYESLEEGFAPVRIVAAGSVTGNDSFKGCRDKDASFNILILAADRSVRLRRMVFEEGGWKQDRDTDLTLFTPEEVRQSRARRRALIDTGEVRAAYTSEIVKYVLFTRERDIQLYWLWTNWKLNDEPFKHRVTNSTGIPVRPVVVLSGDRGAKSIPASFVAIPGEDHAWNLSFTVPKEFLNQPIRVSVQYTWQGGGLLTIEELEALNHDHRLGDFRNESLEFWSSWTNDRTVAALELHLSVPPEYDPIREGGPDAVLVRVHEEGNRTQYEAEAAALQKQLRSLAKGR